MPETLRDHEIFRANDEEQLHDAVTNRLNARVVSVAADPAYLALGRQFVLPKGELWFCSYSHPTLLRFAGGDYLRIQFPRSGRATTATDRRRILVDGTSGCISASEATLEFGPGYRQIAWRVARNELVRKLSAITGLPCVRALEFEHGIDLSAPASSAIVAILESLLTCIDRLEPKPRTLLLTELEEALMIALLSGTSHSLRSLLDRPVQPAAPWQVRRIEEYIVAHCDQAIGIEQFVAISGTSARSIYRTFRTTRGYSPMDFVLERRLERAYQRLGDPASTDSVTDVALGSGFANVSHFSRCFSAAYGESPSAFMRRSR